MSREAFEIFLEMDTQNIEVQLAAQCAPLLMGLRISSLLVIPDSKRKELKELLKDSDIAYCEVLVMGEKTTVLLYDKVKLEAYLSRKKVQKLLKEMGYRRVTFEDILTAFQRRYQNYMYCGRDFPHEMGLLLGYPAGDVEGFILHEGKDFLYTGYWKVYENLPVKMQLFRQFEMAEETVMQLVADGVGIVDIIDIFREGKLWEAAV